MIPLFSSLDIISKESDIENEIHELKKEIYIVENIKTNTFDDIDKIELYSCDDIKSIEAFTFGDRRIKPTDLLLTSNLQNKELQLLGNKSDIYELTKEVYIIQNIDKLSKTEGGVDFADLLVTHMIQEAELKSLQSNLRQINAIKYRGGDICEEEEEERYSSKYNIEHVILNEDGSERPLRKDDLYMDRHKGVLKAFKVIYELQKQYYLKKEYEEEEEESGSSLISVDHYLIDICQRYFLRALDGLTEQGQQELRLCEVCGHLRPFSEFRSESVCGCCGGIIGFSIMRTRELHRAQGFLMN